MKNVYFIIFLFFILPFSCTYENEPHVVIKQTETGFQLYRGGEPYYIRGAGITGHYDMLKEYGGNSIRTWGISEWDRVFEQAEKYGLTVCAGLWMDQEKQGFDYSDADAVEKQFERFKEAILKYKDHPALLMWGIGNELDLDYSNPQVWDAVEQVASFIHEVDGNHPTMTATAFIEREEVELIAEKCPSIDVLCVNAYAGLPVLSRFLKDFGWTKPYIIGEWGPFGHWEVAKTTWNEPIEHSSTEKATLYSRVYPEFIKSDSNCLGAYVFLWGSKQERTATWYSMFLPGGEKTESVDVMRHLWTGEWPENRAPVLVSLKLDGHSAADNIMLKPNTTHIARVYTGDPDNDSLSIFWEILHETTDKRSGGEAEEKPAAVEGLLVKRDGAQVQFRAPQQPGAYRFFVYVYDQMGSGAHANIPFYVKKK